MMMMKKKPWAMHLETNLQTQKMTLLLLMMMMMIPLLTTMQIAMSCQTLAAAAEA